MTCFSEVRVRLGKAWAIGRTILKGYLDSCMALYGTQIGMIDPITVSRHTVKGGCIGGIHMALGHSWQQSPNPCQATMFKKPFLFLSFGKACHEDQTRLTCACRIKSSSWCSASAKRYCRTRHKWYPLERQMDNSSC